MMTLFTQNKKENYLDIESTILEKRESSLGKENFFIIDRYIQQEKYNKIHHYNTRSAKEEKKNTPMDEEEEKYSNSEYTKVVLKALKEAISENEKVIYLKLTKY
jgi:hypothetical protein